MRKRICGFIGMVLLGCGLLPAQGNHPTTPWSVEAASPDPTLVVRGPEIAIDYVDEANWESLSGTFLFSHSYAKQLKSDLSDYVAVVVGADMSVVEVLNKSAFAANQPQAMQPLAVQLPEGGFLLLGVDKQPDQRVVRSFLAEKFQKGDVIKLREQGKSSSLAHLLAQKRGVVTPTLALEGETIQTLVGSKVVVKGKIQHYAGKGQVVVQWAGEEAKSQPLRVNSRGEFTGTLTLNKGVNYLDVCLLAQGEEVARTSLIYFQKEANRDPSEVVLWVEQFPNAKVLTNQEAVRNMVKQAKEAGFTSIGFDVKGPEGYVSYRKNNLSNTPYFTHTVNPKKKVEENGFDLLEAILTESHREALKVYVSFNFFTEGNLTAQDFAVLNDHRHWEEVVQRPEDKGELRYVRESKHGELAAAGQRIALAFVNPASKEVQDFQLLRVEEVLQNYPIDGIVLDRCRYDNLYADFSHESRNQFATYLQAQGKQLTNFPADAFLIDQTGSLVQGQYYVEWICFRSQVIMEFTNRVRQLVDRYKASHNPGLKLAAYVGSWYEVYYQNGVNWASRNFAYNDRLGFPESKIYSAAYSQTSYLHNLDFLMIGTYYKTPQEVNKYITLGNILTHGELPIIGSMSLPDLKREEQTEVFAASLTASSGLMIFDYCYIEWESFLENMRAAFLKIPAKTKKK